MYEPGQLTGGKYRLLQQIGEGGMATVWRATHSHLGHDVAVKFLNNPGSHVDGVVERFLDEARLVASVRHRNIVDVLDFGVAEDGRPYMVMELLEGESLADRLERHPPLSIAEIVELVALVLGGLAAVHDKGIVHRDVKPDNMFLTSDADGFFPKLLDFGISKNLEREAADRFAHTRDGVLLGTPQYMSPEQARGLREIDHRTDIYSMGVMLYEALAGRRPFDSENVGDVLMLVMAGVYTPLSQLRPDMPPELVAVVETAMARERDARFPDARTMRAALVNAAGPYRPTAGSSPDMNIPSEIRSLDSLGLGPIPGTPTGLSRMPIPGTPSALSRIPLAGSPSALARLPTPGQGVVVAGQPDAISTVSIKASTPRELEIATALAPTLVAASGGAVRGAAQTPPGIDLFSSTLGPPVDSALIPPLGPVAKSEPPPPRQESGRGGLLFLASLVLLVAGALGYTEWKYPGRLELLATAIKGAVDRTLHPGAEPEPIGADGSDAGVGDAGPSESVQVKLRGLPDDATIVVDGRTFGPLEIAPLRVGEDRDVVVSIPKRRAPFDVHVTAPGFLPYDGRRWALADVTFRVRLDAAPDAGVANADGAQVTPEPEPRPTRATTRRRRPAPHKRTRTTHRR